jgi:hypothetical protein
MIRNIRGLFNSLPVSEQAQENLKQLNPKTRFKID